MHTHTHSLNPCLPYVRQQTGPGQSGGTFPRPFDLATAIPERLLRLLLLTPPPHSSMTKRSVVRLRYQFLPQGSYDQASYGVARLWEWVGATGLPGTPESDPREEGGAGQRSRGITENRKEGLQDTNCYPSLYYELVVLYEALSFSEDSVSYKYSTTQYNLLPLSVTTRQFLQTRTNAQCLIYFPKPRSERSQKNEAGNATVHKVPASLRRKHSNSIIVIGHLRPFSSLTLKLTLLSANTRMRKESVVTSSLSSPNRDSAPSVAGCDEIFSMIVCDGVGVCLSLRIVFNFLMDSYS
ncbi:unnamed protein product [Pleuronectes platessa]|uniref:Uncharacterized protein n=1 Tax=Pleuronectes platessa TaxID=8262 RepID=A0A9N7YLA5_PLEPL|nr:unnamed protein product [Pleuronectes platessa]